MLGTYKSLQNNGVIGPLMKLDPSGKPIIDPSGEQPGTLVQRPFQEYPKAVKRLKRGSADEYVTYVVNSKAEELKLIASEPEDDLPRSPLERERDELAEQLAVSQKLGGNLSTQLENALARIEQLAAQVDKLTKPTEAPAPAPDALSETFEQREVKRAEDAKTGFSGFAETRALANKA